MFRQTVWKLMTMSVVQSLLLVAILACGLNLIFCFTAACAVSTKAKPAAVELYVTRWCPYCKKAEEFFRNKGIPFTAYDIEADPAAAQRKQELDNRGGVPFAIINGYGYSGFSEAMYEQALIRGN